MNHEKGLPIGRQACRRGRQAVVLLSGGLDSAVTLYLAKSRGFNCQCLAFDYGQRHKREIEAAVKIAAAAHCPLCIIKINLPWRGSSLLEKQLPLPERANRLTAKRLNLIPSTYVAGRNIIFLSFALSYAEVIGSEAVFIGAHIEDYSGYPDCRPEFFRAFARAAAFGTRAGIKKHGIKILTPLIHSSKAQIIKLGLRLKVPFGLTWSCYAGGKVPCGKCDSCYFRAKGFQEAGLGDEGKDSGDF